MLLIFVYIVEVDSWVIRNRVLRMFSMSLVIFYRMMVYIWMGGIRYLVMRLRSILLIRIVVCV